ncbi:MAG: nucleotidyltransferase domain-containing protein [Pseudomonadota bacterium]
MPLHLTNDEYKIIQKAVYKILPASAKVYAFGSRVREVCKPFSDLDLAIDLGKPLSEIEMVNLKDAFDTATIIFKVDIVDLNKISPSFRKSIEPEFISLFH